MRFIEELDTLLRSRFTVILVRTHEEERIVEKVATLCEQGKRSFWIWDLADFFQSVGGRSSNPPPARDPLSALEAIEKEEGNGVFLLRDFHLCWENQPRIVRKLRTLAQRLKYTKKTIIITAPLSTIPEELKDDVFLMDLPLPDEDHLKRIVKRLLQAPGTKYELNAETFEAMIQTAMGLSSNQAQRVFAKAIVSGGQLEQGDLSMIRAEKKEILRASRALELFTPTETTADVGGLETLKQWLEKRRAAFSPSAKAYGLPPPKGIALIGIPGAGKSLSAKMTANLWGMPLVKLDIGALFGSLVGQSEENTRQALQLVETVAPSVLWIDEIEKGLSVGDGDGGTSMRVFGSILSWMQEKKAPVFIVATANNISRLPPELLRRGRFDEVFFLDLPTQVEREAIFAVHIRKRGRDPKAFDIPRLAEAAKGFVGAEIEQGVIDAMYAAFNDVATPGREFTDDDIKGAIANLIPLSASQKEVIEDLRRWLHEGRAQSASFAERKEAQGAFVNLQLDV